jgi:hypothetical protein
MTSLFGVWEFNGNGSPGSMSIFSQDAQGNLEVKVSFQDVNRTDPWTGVWNEAARQITLTRQLPNNVTQTYIGYLGNNHPEIALIFGGSFTESDAGNLQFGWYAKWSSNIIF